MVKTFDAAYEILKPYPSDLFMSIMLAQWALESDYGRSELATQANNFTGHKTTGWSGEVYRKDTLEDDGTGKKFVAKSEPFRKYSSPQEWAKHHASWLQRLPEVYNKAINAKSVQEQAQALQGTYATDTQYAKKLMSMIKDNDLTQFDKGEGNMPTILLIAGHGLNTANGYFDAGATGYVKKGEHRWYTEDVFPAMKKYLPKDADVVFHTAYNVYSQANIVSLAKSYGNDTIVVECHFDSGGVAYSKAGGHVIIYKDFTPDALDLRLRDAIKQTVGLHPSYKDGISKRDNLQNVNLAARGGVNYRLIEWGMSSHKENGTYMVNNVDTIARAFVKALFNTDVPDKPKPTPSGDFELPAYKQPTQPFKELKVGDLATIRSGQTYWYIPDGKGRKPSKDFAGDKDTITKVMPVNVGYSKRAYLLKNKRSWILEQDLVEPRSEWSSEQKDQQEQLDYVYIDGVKRIIGDIVK